MIIKDVEIMVLVWSPSGFMFSYLLLQLLFNHFILQSFFNQFIAFSVLACPDVKYGKRIHVLPIDDTVEGLTG